MWHWGSLAKSLTSAVFLQLVAQGNLPSLDVPLVDVVGVGAGGPFATVQLRHVLLVRMCDRLRWHCSMTPRHALHLLVSCVCFCRSTEEACLMR
jgi:hypothetical protein